MTTYVIIFTMYTLLTLIATLGKSNYHSLSFIMSVPYRKLYTKYMCKAATLQSHTHVSNGRIAVLGCYCFIL
jgi:hypothetical protein